MFKKAPKKVIVIIISVLAVLLGLVIVVKIFVKPSKQKSISPVGEKQQKKEPEFQVDLKEWNDPAGFAFLHPDDLKITSVEEDEVNYARLILSKDGALGKIEITCGDSQFASLDDWAKNDKLAKEGSALETEIASMSAKKVALNEGREIAAVIDADQVIYKFVKESEGEEYWDRVFRAVLSTFRLVPLEGESEADFQQWLGDFDVSGADIVEAVEVIE